MLQLLQACDYVVNFIAYIQTDVGRDLIIARAASVQLLASRPDAARKLGLDVHVNIFQLHRPLKASRLNVFRNGSETVYDSLTLVRLEYTCLLQHSGMDNRTGDVVTVKALVKVDPGGKAL